MAVWVSGCSNIPRGCSSSLPFRNWQFKTTGCPWLHYELCLILRKCPIQSAPPIQSTSPIHTVYSVSFALVCFSLQTFLAPNNFQTVLVVAKWQISNSKRLVCKRQQRANWANYFCNCQFYAICNWQFCSFGSLSNLLVLTLINLWPTQRIHISPIIV